MPIALISALALVFFVQRIAWANAGSALVLTQIGHLCFLNALIGIVEARILTLMFTLPKSKTVLTMIAANYLSWWLGGTLGLMLIIELLPIDIYNLHIYQWILAIVAFAITLVLEFPFVVFLLKRQSRWLTKSIAGNLTMQTVSYVLIFGWYLWLSPSAFHYDMHATPSNQIELPQDVLVCYIDPENRNVHVTELTMGKNVKTYKIAAEYSEYERLFVRPSKDHPERWELLAWVEQGSSAATVEVLDTDFASNGPDYSLRGPDGKTLQLYDGEGRSYETVMASTNVVPTLGDARQSPWHFEMVYPSFAGVRGRNWNTRESLWLLFEGIFVRWSIQNAVLLPGDKLLFQLGQDQICVYDVPTRRLAIIARGHGLTAVMRDPPAES